MSYYTIETWTIRDVAKAFNFRDTSTSFTDRKVVIPIFQRGLRWEPKKRSQFIDSLDRGYPFGSLLFAKQEGINKYSVVDGLQRGSTACDYVFNPLAKNNINSVDEEVLDAIRIALFPDNESKSINKKIEEQILSYFYEKKRFDCVDLSDLADIIYDSFPNTEDYRICRTKIKNAISPFYAKRKEKYDNICASSVPIVVYSGPQELLNEIFNRINKNGTPLNDFEIYSATWSHKPILVNNTEVIEKVIKKYWALSDLGYEIDGFDATLMRTKKELTAFEFLFGLGKYWYDKFDCLKVESKNKDDDVNEISFEIVDACINQTKSISNLDKVLQRLNINKLQRRIEESITYVSNAIAVVSSFKGNKRKFNVLHSKYQIISLISFTFREMYDINNLETKKDDWNRKSQIIAKKLLSHYVADIISGEWHDGGAAKVYSFTKERKYLEDISLDRWGSLLDNHYFAQLQNKQNERFTNPVNADCVILNCIYVTLFTASDQLSSQKFDIEHLATKERMKNILNNFNDLKLPICCIANLCYLPEDINRGKKEKTIYEATNLSLPISVIEEKYSFTVEDDLKWITYPYTSEDQTLFVSNYEKFIASRYSKIKARFLEMFK
ncbi:MAG: DUF262 domain-containing protein [Ruminococcaceae bacterium]|nr:DUF262 domain-containing protein [Oscillospiraceae bacterium]